MRTRTLRLPVGRIDVIAVLALVGEIARQKGVLQVQIYGGEEMAYVKYDADIVSPSDLSAATRRLRRGRMPGYRP